MNTQKDAHIIMTRARALVSQKRLLYAAFFILLLGLAITWQIPSFHSSKIYLKHLYTNQNNPKTFYCQALFDPAKGYALACPQGWSKEDCAVEWDHIVPAALLAKTLPCSQKNSCPWNPHQSYRKCCQETSVEFAFREANVVNLMPSLRKMNRAKSHFLPGIVLDKPFVRTVCGVKFDKKTQTFEPPDRLKGWIARIYLYMDELYDLPLSEHQRKLLRDWDRSYSIGEEEKRHYQLLNMSHQIIQNKEQDGLSANF